MGRKISAETATAPAADGKIGLEPSHVAGGAKAAVTLEEFGDFQCPACATTTATVKSLEKEYGDRLRVIFWQFPLPVTIHEHAREAAHVAEAASRQGQFWQMHDLLYTNQNSWSSSPNAREQFEKLAEQLHLDAERFRKDVASPEVAARVEAEHEYGVSRGVKGTPTLFINGEEFSPPFTVERLRAAFEAAATPAKSAQ